MQGSCQRITEAWPGHCRSLLIAQGIKVFLAHPLAPIRSCTAGQGTSSTRCDCCCCSRGAPGQLCVHADRWGLHVSHLEALLHWTALEQVGDAVSLSCRAQYTQQPLGQAQLLHPPRYCIFPTGWPPRCNTTLSRYLASWQRQVVSMKGCHHSCSIRLPVGMFIECHKDVCAASQGHTPVQRLCHPCRASHGSGCP